MSKGAEPINLPCLVRMLNPVKAMPSPERGRCVGAQGGADLPPLIMKHPVASGIQISCSMDREHFVHRRGAPSISPSTPQRSPELPLEVPREGSPLTPPTAAHEETLDKRIMYSYT